MKRSVLPCWKLSILYKPAFQRLAAAIVSVCFFAAAVSVPAVAIETQGYTDVNPGNIWYEDIMEATEEGIVSGIGNGQFAPDRPVTMLGFATMLGRYLNRFEGLDAYWLESPLLMINAYLDANNGHAAGDCLTRRDAVCLVFAATAATPWPQKEERFHDLGSLPSEERNQIECAAALGLIPDDGTGLFHPEQSVTRAEAVSMILSLHHVPEDTESTLRPVSLSGFRLTYENEDAVRHSFRSRVYLAAMPEAVLEEFAERDWELRFMTSGLETLNASYAGGLGVTIPSGKNICVDVGASAFLRDNTTVLHEMGHFEEQYASAQEEVAITNAFQKEQVLMAAFLHRDYCRKNVEEYFAEVFRAYLLGKDFSETEPLTWAAMEMLSRTWEADT